MMPPKLATLGLIKTKAFWNKGYDVIISVHGVANKILLRDSNYVNQSLVTLALLWEKLSNLNL